MRHKIKEDEFVNNVIKENLLLWQQFKIYDDVVEERELMLFAWCILRTSMELVRGIRESTVLKFQREYMDIMNKQYNMDAKAQARADNYCRCLHTDHFVGSDRFPTTIDSLIQHANISVQPDAATQQALSSKIGLALRTSTESYKTLKVR
jgi:hypothetical protein